MKASIFQGLVVLLATVAIVQGEEFACLSEYVPSYLPAQSETQAWLSLAEAVVLPEDVVVFPKRTDADRWMEFEQEYRIYERNPVWALSMIQTAKFGLDKLSFTAKETARKLEFSYEFGGASDGDPHRFSPGSAYSLPLFGKFGNAKIKTVISEHDSQTSKSFIGLKLNVPFGKGKSEYY